MVMSSQRTFPMIAVYDGNRGGVRRADGHQRNLANWKPEKPMITARGGTSHRSVDRSMLNEIRDLTFWPLANNESASDLHADFRLFGIRGFVISTNSSSRCLLQNVTIH
jgi:hypothetical protein